MGAGGAEARTIKGTARADKLVGTTRADAVYGRAGNDRIDGRSGADFLHGGPGRDRVVAGPGGDRIVVQSDQAVDSVVCGRGRDIVNAELFDSVAANCEVVVRQLSRDTDTHPDSQHETQVEPDSFSFGRTVVTAFQSGRFIDGGASAVGFATSVDAGRTWRAGLLPGLTEIATDPSVAYDAAHRLWLVATLGRTGGEDRLLVNRSSDGLAWGQAITAVRDERDAGLDKEWIACDNWSGSRFRGRCYLAYYEVDTGRIETRHSTDGGRTWSRPAIAARGSVSRFVNGVQPVVQPNGNVVLVYTDFAAFVGARSHRIVSARSTDGGVTFDEPVEVAQHEAVEIRAVRTPSFVSADVSGTGTIYLAWHDCVFRDDCAANDIVLATSADGVTWRGPKRVPTGSRYGEVDYFIPGLAVDPATAGGRAELAVVYHAMPQCSGFPTCGIDVWLIRSGDGGRTWRAPQRLTAESMLLRWIAESALGYMLADYVSVSFVAGRPVPVFALASEPRFDVFQQAIFALEPRAAASR